MLLYSPVSLLGRSVVIKSCLLVRT